MVGNRGVSDHIFRPRLQVFVHPLFGEAALETCQSPYRIEIAAEVLRNNRPSNKGEQRFTAVIGNLPEASLPPLACEACHAYSLRFEINFAPSTEPNLNGTKSN